MLKSKQQILSRPGWTRKLLERQDFCTELWENPVNRGFDHMVMYDMDDILAFEETPYFQGRLREIARRRRELEEAKADAMSYAKKAELTFEWREPGILGGWEKANAPTKLAHLLRCTNCVQIAADAGARFSEASGGCDPGMIMIELEKIARRRALKLIDAMHPELDICRTCGLGTQCISDAEMLELVQRPVSYEIEQVERAERQGFQIGDGLDMGLSENALWDDLMRVSDFEAVLGTYAWQLEAEAILKRRFAAQAEARYPGVRERMRACLEAEARRMRKPPDYLLS